MEVPEWLFSFGLNKPQAGEPQEPKKNAFCEICLNAGRQYFFKTKTKGWMGFYL